MAVSACASREAHKTPPLASIVFTGYNSDRSLAFLEITNHSKLLLMYHGPYIEMRTPAGWREHHFDPTAMALLGKGQRLRPLDVKSVHFPPPQRGMLWRAYVVGEGLPTSWSTQFLRRPPQRFRAGTAEIRDENR